MKKLLFLLSILFVSAPLFADVQKDLYDSINSGNLEGVKKDLAQGADPNYSGPNYAYGEYLMLAAFAGQMEMIQLLLDHGADIQATNSAGENMLYASCINPGNKKVIQFFLDKGLDKEVRNIYEGYTPMLVACSTTYINWPAARQLIEAGCNLHAVDKKGRNALMLAVLCDMHVTPVKFLEYLVDKGIDINAVDNETKTALMHACMAGDYFVKGTRYLIDKGADVLRRDKYGNTALHYLVQASESRELLLYLAGKYKDINMRNLDGATPLTLAREAYNNGSMDIIKSLGGKEMPVRFHLETGDKVYGFYDKRIWTTGVVQKVDKRGIQVRFNDGKIEVLSPDKVFKDQFPYFWMLKPGTRILCRDPNGYLATGHIAKIADKKYYIDLDDGQKNTLERVDLIVIE